MFQRNRRIFSPQLRIINMKGQKSLQSVDSTAIRRGDESVSSQSPQTSLSPQRWQLLESKYLKYISLLKSKAEKFKKKLTHPGKYPQLLYCLKYKVQARMMGAFKTIELIQRGSQMGVGRAGEGERGMEREGRREGGNVRELGERIQRVLNKHRRSALLLIKIRSEETLSRQHRLLGETARDSSPSKKETANPQKHTLVIDQLQRLQSTINSYSCLDSPKDHLVLKVENSRLREEMKQLEESNKSLRRQLLSTQERMEVELLKKSLALMECEVDSQEKQELIKQYQIQLQCRVNQDNRVLLFTLEDFQVERRRLELINQKMFKEFESTKQAFVEEIKNQNGVMSQLKFKLNKANVMIAERKEELESLRAYRFQHQYEKQCQKYKQFTRFNSLRLPSQPSQPQDSFTLSLLKHIQSYVLGQPLTQNIIQHLTHQETLLLQSIQQKISSAPATTIKNKVIKMNSLERSIAFQENVRVSNQDLDSFLDIFQAQNSPPNTSIDARVHQHLEAKVLSLNQRLLEVRKLILSLLQSIQIKNPTPDLLTLIESINDIFEFSDPEKQSFHGGRKSLFHRLFS